MPAPAGVCDTFRGDLPSDRSWGFGIRKTTLVVATESLSRRSLLSDLTILGIGPKGDFLNEALVPLKADPSHNADGGKVQRGNTSMHSKQLEPHELDKFAHCDARALRATRRGVSGRDARSRLQPEHCFAIDTAAAPQWLSPNSDLGRL